MKRFARLYAELDETTKTLGKTGAMAHYFSTADPADAAWAVHFLSGGRPKRLIPVRRLAAWAMEVAGVPEWLFDECYASVGDLAETISLLLPAAVRETDLPLHHWIEGRLLAMAGESEQRQRETIVVAWEELDGVERFVWNKLITGAFRVGVSQSLVVRALAKSSGIDEATITHRLSGSWLPTADAFRQLIAADAGEGDVSRPYPFFLAYALEGDPSSLGDAAEWQVEWKWDGIRAQLIRRQGRTYLWSRGEESVGERFPELADVAKLLPDGTVLDGEIMPWKGGPLPFAQLQRRIGRKTLGAKVLADVPVVLVVYDLLERGGDDIRSWPLARRREALVRLLAETHGAASRLLLSPCVETIGWEAVRQAHDEAREKSAEGLMLKRLDAPYGVGRRRGPWWKWKVQPYTADAVLVYAQAGSGRRASLHTDYTFALWNDEGELVPFAKAYSGLTDAELRQLDVWIRRNTVEKFGPVRSVKHAQVFELAFEGIQPSPRHKSGVAVRFPRILRWRTDKKPEDADTLATLRAMMQQR